MARGKAAAEEEVEEAEGDLSASELALGELLDQLNQTSQRLSAKVRRIMRPQDEGIQGVSAGYVGRLAVLNPATLEEDIHKITGNSGGTFALEIYVDGQYQRGLTRTVELDGPARAKPDPNVKTETAVPGAMAKAATDTPEVLALRASVARLEAEAAARTRAAEREADQRALAAMIAAAMAPITAKLEAVAVKQAPALSPLEELTVARMKREDKASAEGVEPAYVTALKATVEKMEATLKAQEKDRAEEKHARELEKRDREIAELRSEIEAVVEQANAPRAKNPLLENLTESMVTVATIDKLLNAGRSENEPRTDFFKDFMEKNGKRIITAIGPSVEKKLDDVMGTLTNGGAATPPPTPGVPPEDGSAFAVWLQEQWNAKPPLSACRDPQAIHARLKSHPKTLSALAAVRDAERLKAFLKGLGAFPAAMVDSSVTGPFWAEMAPRLDELRATLDALVAAARQEAEKNERAEAAKAAASKASEPRATVEPKDASESASEDDAEEDGDGDEDEDEDEAEGEGDGEEADDEG